MASKTVISPVRVEETTAVVCFPLISVEPPMRVSGSRMGVIANAGSYVEFSIEPTSYYSWQEGQFAPALEVQDGKVQIPDAPGWSAEISPVWLAAAEHRVSKLD